MYCPNCGQQQVSDEMRFCSRCGFALTGLADWLAGSAMLAKRADETSVSALSPRRKGIRRAGKVMFASGVMFPVFLAMSLVNHGELMLFPILVFFVSVVMMLYARLFSDPIAPVTHLTSPLGSISTRTPAATSTAGRRQVRTNELAPPPSVTEHTTKLLDNE